MSSSTPDAELYLEKMREFTRSQDGSVHEATLQGDNAPTKFLICAGVFPRGSDRKFFSLIIDDTLPATQPVCDLIHIAILRSRVINEREPKSIDDPILFDSNKKYQAALEMPIIVFAIGRGRAGLLDNMRLYTISGLSSSTALAEMKHLIWISSQIKQFQGGNLSA